MKLTPLAPLSFVLALFTACAAPRHQESAVEAHAASAPTPNSIVLDGAKGWLCIVGGGGTTDAMYERMFAAAGGKGAKVVILPQASELAETGKESVETWTKHGATNVEWLDLKDPARDREKVRAASVIWFPGGVQTRLMKALHEAGIVEIVRQRFVDGAVVGGTSAGAAVLSATMIIGGDRADLTNVKSGGTEMAEGLGLWPGALVDQHFLKRQRFNRLLSGVLDHPDLVGVGIDERTGVILHPDGVCEVVGDGGVLVIDARRANRRPAAKSELQSADSMTLAIHKAGERFTLALPQAR